jgi:hypothetical protein
MKTKRVPIDEFDQTLKETVAENEQVYVLFFGKQVTYTLLKFHGSIQN